MKKICFILWFTVCSLQLIAQPYTQKQTRHRFAQLLIGADYRFMPGIYTQTTYLNAENQPQATTLNNQHEARLLIGATHFWGHADLYVAFPVKNWSKGNTDFSTGIETGAKYYPWRIEHNKIRPYAGVSLNTSSFKQNGGPTQTKVQFPLLAGLTFSRDRHLLELGFAFNYNNKAIYYVSRNDFTRIKTYPLWISFGYKFMLDATIGDEKEWLDGTTKERTKELVREGKLSGFSLAVGPSSTWFTRTSEYNNEQRPYLGNHKIEGGFFEFGAGYYFQPWDAHINLSYRKINSGLSAYGLHQELDRRALTLEAYKFLFDYNGFVPFVGPALSKEWLSVDEYDEGNLTAQGAFNGIKPGITFGWDIRPNKLKAWYLRTNLRYFPNLNVTMPNGQKVAFDQIEFNFIQIVVYPQRFNLK